MALKYKRCSALRESLHKKLFYSAWIRYMTESYLEMSHTCVFFMAISTDYVTFQDKISLVVRVTLLVILVIWPFFVLTFLLKNRKKLDTDSFKKKFISMYNGLKTTKTGALLYAFLFCMRRMSLVLTFVLLQDEGIWLILSFNGLQSLQFWYLVYAVPHDKPVHN